MPAHYNEIAGQNVGRLEALSDGIFAVAMTLLVLDLRVPSVGSVHSEHELWLAIVALSPRILMYLMSFLTLGIFWLGQQTELNQLEGCNRNLAWIHLGFLFCVVLLPFSTMLLAEFITFRLALVLYWLNLLMLGVALYASWGYAQHARLIGPGVSHEIAAAICRRILYAQSLYALGALLCLVKTYWSIGFIVAVQLNYVVAPRFWRKGKKGADSSAS
ncbi:MAG TPA: TMEM175 family protein [Verrucomicrobiae bacterium]|nr:TMEM175 family protein [Verrucomicrobiae bacterium]